jgi:hypothetical protein
MQNYEYAFAKNSPYTFSTDIVGGGVTAIYDKFYVDVDFKTNFNKASYTIKNDVSVQYSEDEVDFYSDIIEFDRKDFALTGGYSFGEVSIFAGYKYGKSIFDGRYVFDNNNTINYQESLMSDGIFIGAAYSLMLSDTDVLSFSFAYADLSVEYKAAVLNEDSSISKYNGDGISLSAKWSHYLESGKSVYLKFETQNYEYEEEFDEEFGKVTLTETETMSRLTFGVTF